VKDDLGSDRSWRDKAYLMGARRESESKLELFQWASVVSNGFTEVIRCRGRKIAVTGVVDVMTFGGF